MSGSKTNEKKCLKNNDLMLFARKRRMDKQARARRVERVKSLRKERPKDER